MFGLRRGDLDLETGRLRIQRCLPDEHFHDVRHPGLRLVAQGGATTREIMARGRHSTARASPTYQHVAESRGAQIAATMGLLAQVARETCSGTFPTVMAHEWHMTSFEVA